MGLEKKERQKENKEMIPVLAHKSDVMELENTAENRIQGDGWMQR